LGEVAAEVRGGEEFLFPGGGVAELFEKLDAFVAASLAVCGRFCAQPEPSQAD
jgi:hypothetical protein